ncbi:peptidoglycan-binding protein [Pseudooceanicola sp. CBS1P-1]|uniref:Peptidoglycan binding-like domain-containing protein n=1 Tax=Pseudooceanicola albus TaxID=2692189 RepID=A0A6L7G512_9RHOB|nr:MULTISPECIES: peptidoglycan-binding domain-containing protein [Pseudooceanicola]MBT9383027.1 peptidoglycan-binding protein [Pseudooceanicola endophyticus]MXN19215.1 hypothetical protein [Pseudooceanicola albus]
MRIPGGPLALLLLGLGTALPGAALAVPCVGENFDQPLPGATGVARETVDVPAANYPGLWQKGIVAGYVYRLYADLTGTLEAWSDTGPSPWRIDVTCRSGESCSQSQRGTPPEEASLAAAALGNCLLGQAVSAADFTAPAPAPAPAAAPAPALAPADAPADAAETGRPAGLSGGDSTSAAQAVAAGEAPPAPDTAPAGGEAPPDGAGPQSAPPQAPATPCGLASIQPGRNPVQTLQRLLGAAGQDPGPADGLMGTRTRQALAALLGNQQAAALSVEQAVSALDQRLCRPE